MRVNRACQERTLRQAQTRPYILVLTKTRHILETTVLWIHMYHSLGSRGPLQPSIKPWVLNLSLQPEQVSKGAPECDN